MVTTTRYYSWIWLTLLSILLQPAFAAESLTASVDRTELAEGESLQLQVTGVLDVNISFNIFNLNLPRPELEPLKRDFDVLEQRQRYNFQNINGQNQAMVTWTYTLMPKRSGTLTIPALAFKDSQSQPIEIEVTRQTAATRRSDSVFLEAEVSKQKLFVQEQLIFTLRLNYQDNILAGDLSEPDVPNAVLRQIDPQKEYSRILDGQRFDVIERRYVIIPQTSGSFEIPPQQFAGTLYDIRLRDRRYVRASSEPVSVEVVPPPADAKGQPWLPAMGLSLTENWSRTPENLDVGDSVTRTVTIKALGLEGSQLPPLAGAQAAGLKQYPEQPQIETETHDEGVTGTRIERTAFVAVKPGEFELPEISLRWWDTLNSEWKTAVVPARTVSIKGTAAAQAPAPTPVPAEPAVVEEPEAPPAPVTATETSNPWPLISLVLLLGWLATTAFLLTRRKPHMPAAPMTKSAPADAEEQAYQQLASLSGQNWNSIRPALLSWAKACWPERQIYALSDLNDVAQAGTLSQIIQAFEAAHYSPHGEADASTADSRRLLQEVETIRMAKRQRQSAKEAELADLYPSTPR